MNPLTLIVFLMRKRTKTLLFCAVCTLVLSACGREEYEFQPRCPITSYRAVVEAVPVDFDEQGCPIEAESE
jgi:uncharacterized lipoprotein YajG